MLRKVIITTPLETDDLIEKKELGAAPFALFVEYPPPKKKDQYRLKLRIVTRDREVDELIARHGLSKVELHVDRDVLAVEAKRKALGEEVQEGLAQGGLGYIWSFAPWIAAGRSVLIWAEELRTVRVSFSTLLEGLEVTGKMQEVTWLARELTNAIDRIAAQIDTGRAFDVGELRIFAPGKKVKHEKNKPRTPPSKWGR